MHRAFGLKFAILLGVSAIATPLAAAPVYSPITGNYYDYINRNIEDTDYATWTWEEARADAESRTFMGMQGHLVTITSAAEEAVLIDHFWADILYGQPHIGGFRAPGSDPLTGWQWVTGEPFIYTNWRTGEPNNAGGGEIYLHYQSVNVASPQQFDSWGWNDMLNERRGYFIEYSADVPEPSLLALAGLGLIGAAIRRRR